MLTPEAWKQLALLGFETLIVASLILILFNLRHRLGLSPLFATLGVFQYLQVMLALSLYVEILPNISISPGSAVLFSGTQFALLLVFLRENPTETRTLVFGLLTANLTLSLLSLLFGFHLESPLAQNPYGLPKELFTLDVRVLVVGTVTLVLDMFLLMFLYQALAKIIEHWLSLRIFATLAIVLTFDSLLFVTGCFVQEPFFVSALQSAVLAKIAAALIYAPMLAGYLYWVEPTAGHGPVRSLADVFQLLLSRNATDTWLESTPRDAVLGIPSEVGLRQALDRHLVLAEHLEIPAHVMVVKAVDWQTINRDQGRERANDLLHYLVAVICSVLETKDVHGRLGTDSIAIVLAGASARTRKLMEDISSALERSLSRIRPSEEVQDVRIRLGWSEFPIDGQRGDELLLLAAARDCRAK